MFKLIFVITLCYLVQDSPYSYPPPPTKYITKFNILYISGFRFVLNGPNHRETAIVEFIKIL